jgi:hypothetical protein
MKNINNTQQDLQFISEAVKASDQNSVPSIYAIWAVITLIGYSMIDWAPNSVGLFWAFAGPLGGLASYYLGHRHAKITGQVARKDGLKHALHWIAMLAAIFMTVFLAHWGYVTPKGQSLVILMITAFSYITAGNYLDKNLRFIGIVMGLCFFPIAMYGQYVWTGLAVVFSAALAITAVMESRNARQAR